MGSMKDAFNKAGMEKVEKMANNTKLFLRVPTIKKVETTAETQEIIDKAIIARRQYLENIPAHMADLVGRIRKIQGTSPEERSVRSKELKQLVDEVFSHLNSEEELLRNAAAQAYALAMVSTLPTDKRVVMETVQGGNHYRLPGLLELRILIPIDKETVKDAVIVKVYGKTFRINGQRDFAVGLASALSEGAGRAAKAAHERYHGQVETLKGQATVSVVEMYEGKSGCLCLEVPDMKEGERFFSGGVLLAKSDGKKMEVIQAVGHFQRVLEELRDTGTFVTVESLKSGKLSYIPDKEKFRQTRILHTVLRRGIAEAQAQSEKETVKKRLENL